MVDEYQLSRRFICCSLSYQVDLGPGVEPSPTRYTESGRVSVRGRCIVANVTSESEFSREVQECRVTLKTLTGEPTKFAVTFLQSLDGGQTFSLRGAFYVHTFRLAIDVFANQGWTENEMFIQKGVTGTESGTWIGFYAHSKPDDKVDMDALLQRANSSDQGQTPDYPMQGLME
jgi:hypothetical protein